MLFRSGLLTAALLLLFGTAAPATHAQATLPGAPRKSIDAVRIVDAAPRIDGRLDEPVWEEARWVSDFLQREPVEGATPSQRTEVAILYDDQAIYVAARLHTNDPEAIRALVTRRDNETNAEQIAVSFDTYLNRRTAYTFAVTAGGVRLDYYHGSDSQGSTDYSFDPVWTADAHIGATGWTAEMRIPFSQLRFNDADELVWGLNFNRKIPSQNEDVYWIYVPREETGWASRFGTLQGMRGVRPSRRLEMLPYVASSATVPGEVDANNPFEDRFQNSVRIGGDVKVGLGSNLTLDATINPDFGQVDADPAEVNLSAFETFFSERRPFFNEGSDLLGSGLFYSRRIGTAPRGPASGDFVDRPDNTTILGAAKLSGRLSSGFSLAALGAVTDAEHAETFNADTDAFGKVKVEPLTGFLALAGQQEFGPNESTVGFIGTAVRRNMADDDPVASVLNEQAYAGQIGWNLRFADGAYQIQGAASASHVRGTAARLAALQRSSVHYFQRPDADYVDLDPTRTSLSGWAGNVWFGKNTGAWTGGTFFSMESPGYERNDLGRLGRTDEIGWFTEIGYRETEPRGIFHRYSVEVSSYNSWNFGGQRVNNGADADVDITWRNFWFTSVFAGFNPRTFSDTATRGGPRMAIAAERNVGVFIRTNRARRFLTSFFVFYEKDELDRTDFEVEPDISWQPNERLDLSFGPGYARTIGARQYVTTRDDGSAATFGGRYVFSRIDRTRLSIQLRVNYTFTPDLTLELYAEPFAASGHFYDFGELAEAGKIDLRRYGTDGTTLTETDGGFLVTDGADSFTLRNRDFNVISFRSNLVLRWEWRPGSSLFLVWQQDRSGFEQNDAFVRPATLFESFGATGDNFFSIKLSYWIPAG